MEMWGLMEGLGGVEGKDCKDDKYHVLDFFVYGYDIIVGN